MVRNDNNSGKGFFQVIAVIALLTVAQFVFADYTPIDEGLVVNTYHVDQGHPSASDSNPGTASLPFETIDKGISQASIDKAGNIGAKVLIYPGVYRETINRNGSTTNAPIVIEAVQLGTVIIDGSDAFTAWSLKTGTSNIYEHSWTNNWGTYYGSDPLPDIVARREIVFVNDQLYKQVLEYADLVPGTYQVDESANKLYICSDIVITSATVDVGMRGGWNSASYFDNDCFRMTGYKNLIVRGITVQRAANNYYHAAFTINQCENSLVEDCTAEWNNFTSASFWNSTDLMVRRFSATYNGYKSSTGNNIDIIIEDSEFSYQNWRGAWGQYYAWDTAGLKAWTDHGITFRNCDFIGNQAAGLWFDSHQASTNNVTDVTIENCRFNENYLQGLALENTVGPVSITNSDFVCNDWSGILAHTTKDVTVNNCLFKSNKGLFRFAEFGAQLKLGGPDAAAAGLTIRNWVITNNTFISSSPDAPLIEVDNSDWSGSTYSTFISTLSSSGNTGYHPDSNKSFKVGYINKNLSAWQSETSQDSDFTLTEKTYCGCGQGNLPTDLDSDCYVTSADLSIMVFDWTDCADPTPPLPSVELVTGGEFDSIALWYPSGGTDTGAPYYESDGVYVGMYFAHMDEYSSHCYRFQPLGTATEGATYTISADMTVRSYGQLGYVPGNVTVYTALAIAPSSVDPLQIGVNLEGYIVRQIDRIEPVPTSNTSGSTEGDGYWLPEVTFSDSYTASAGDDGKDLYVLVGGFVSPSQDDGGLQLGVGVISVISDDPEPQQEYLTGDIDKSLCVDINDGAFMARQWLSCNNYDDPACD